VELSGQGGTSLLILGCLAIVPSVPSSSLLAPIKRAPQQLEGSIKGLVRNWVTLAKEWDGGSIENARKTAYYRSNGYD